MIIRLITKKSQKVCTPVTSARDNLIRERFAIIIIALHTFRLHGKLLPQPFCRIIFQSLIEKRGADLASRFARIPAELQKFRRDFVICPGAAGKVKSRNFAVAARAA